MCISVQAFRDTATSTQYLKLLDDTFSLFLLTQGTRINEMKREEESSLRVRLPFASAVPAPNNQKHAFHQLIRFISLLYEV